VTWQRAAFLNDVGDARPWLPLTVGGVDLVVASVDGALYGVEDRCSHAGCAFSEDADLIGALISCNCHGSEFDIRTGEVRRGPAERPIRTIPVRVAGDRIEVDL
jgi:nitrite reductase/ring-hydroxylating ferredoxin subunit